MRGSYKPYVPQTIGELMDKLGSMMIYSPTFKDPLGEFPHRNIETEFFALNEGLGVLRKKLGEERYEALLALSHRMRAHFEADPEDKSDDSRAGCKLILEMQDLLRPRRARK